MRYFRAFALVALFAAVCDCGSGTVVRYDPMESVRHCGKYWFMQFRGRSKAEVRWILGAESRAQYWTDWDGDGKTDTLVIASTSPVADCSIARECKPMERLNTVVLIPCGASAENAVGVARWCGGVIVRAWISHRTAGGWLNVTECNAFGECKTHRFSRS